MALSQSDDAIVLQAVKRGWIAPSDLPALRALRAEQPEGSLLALLGREGILDPDQVAALQPVTVRENPFSLPGRTVDPAALARAFGGPRPSGRYQIGEPLGSGGMGDVHRATDPALGRRVAFKRLRTDDPAQLARFVREARITAQLAHPNIVPVYELATDADGQPYYTMKEIEGRTLGDCIEAGDLSASALLQSFLKVCDALAFAHARGVIHRDLKPANIMIGAFGEVLVVDWGLAKVTGETEEPISSDTPDPDGPAVETVAGSVMGTPAYMSPEQADGRIPDLDAKSDVYALGAILYQLLTGLPPFEGDSVHEVLMAVLQGKLVPPSQRTPERPIPWELEAVVLRAMATDPAERYPSVEALRADIEHFLEGRTLAAARYSTRQRLLKWLRRHKAAAAVATVVLIALGILGWTNFGPGWVVIEARPAGAHILVNGADRGPRTRLLLWPPGRYRLGARHPGRLPVEQTIDVAAARTARVTLELPSDSGTLTLKVAPAGARIALERDGRSAGVLTGPQRLTSLRVGTYLARISAPRHSGADRLPHRVRPTNHAPHYPPRARARLPDRRRRRLVYPATREEFTRALGPSRPPKAPKISFARPIWDHQIPDPEKSPPQFQLALPVTRFKLDTGYYRLIYTRQNHGSREQYARIDPAPPEAAVRKRLRKMLGVSIARLDAVPGAFAVTGKGNQRWTLSRALLDETAAGATLPRRELWSFATGGAVLSSPALADLDGDGTPDAVVGGKKVYAICGRTGSPLWVFATGGAEPSSPALADLDGDGTPDVVVGSSDKKVYAISGRTGKPLWAFPTGGPVSSTPALADLDGDGTPDAVVGSWDKKVYAISGRTGRPLWAFATGGQVWSSPALADLDGDGTPDAVVGSNDGKLHAISGRTGRPLWAFHTGGDVVVSSPALADLDGDGTYDAVVGSWDKKKVHAISGRTGRPLWAFATGGPVFSSAALADLDGDGTPDAVIGSLDKKVHAISGRTGRPLWAFATGDRVLSSPALADLDGDGTPDAVVGSDDKKAVVGSNDGKLHAISGRTGRPLWACSAGMWVWYFSPSLADLDGDGTPDVVIGSEDKKLQAISGRTGRLLWSVATAGAVRSSPVLADLDGDGTLQYRLQACHGNPFLRLLRRELETLVEEKHGGRHLEQQQGKAELARINRELRRLRRETADLEQRRSEILARLDG